MRLNHRPRKALALEVQLVSCMPVLLRPVETAGTSHEWRGNYPVFALNFDLVARQKTGKMRPAHVCEHLVLRLL